MISKIFRQWSPLRQLHKYTSRNEVKISKLPQNEQSHKAFKETGGQINRTVRAFISYSTEDKIIAGKIKNGLEKYGIETFLAHEDINPATEWQNVIIDSLESTDILIPIITSNFSLSNWTDQEVGIAFARNKVIVPISIDGNQPYGFIGKYQSLKLEINLREQNLNCSEIIKAIIIRKPQFSIQILDSVIKLLSESQSWINSAEKIETILEFNGISEKQINTIFHAVLENKQISQSFKAQNGINKLFKLYGNMISNEIKEELTNREIITLPSNKIIDED